MANLAKCELHFFNAEQKGPRAACSQCSFGKLCFPPVLPAFYQMLLPMASETRLRLKRGQCLFNIDDRQTGIFAVKAGFLKTCITLADGQSKVIGFHTMGDAVGMGGLGHGLHTTSAIALNDCEVCVIPLDKFERLLEHKSESVYVRQLLAREVVRIERHAAEVGALSAKQLVAKFLLEISARWHDRGYSKNKFVLFMSRKEIGSYLGLTFETVGRTLSYFDCMDWIKIDAKNVLILDLTALQTQLARPT